MARSRSSHGRFRSPELPYDVRLHPHHVPASDFLPTVDSHIAIANITTLIEGHVAESKIVRGSLLLWALHTTTALFVNEAEEGLLSADYVRTLRRICPRTGDGASYQHDREERLQANPDEPPNGDSHCLAMLLNRSLKIPLRDGRLLLGTWQSVLFVDFDPGVHRPSRTTIFQIEGLFQK